MAAAWQRVEAQDPSPGKAGIPTAAIPWNFPCWFPVSVRLNPMMASLFLKKKMFWIIM